MFHRTRIDSIGIRNVIILYEGVESCNPMESIGPSDTNRFHWTCIYTDGAEISPLIHCEIRNSIIPLLISTEVLCCGKQCFASIGTVNNELAVVKTPIRHE